MKHNPNTIRKVIAPFIITFKNGVKGVVEKLKNMVKRKERLDDMPVYKNSLQITGEFRKCFVLTTVEALLTDTLASGQLYLRPPCLKPRFNSHTNSVFLHSRKRTFP